jgi:hypothetical protein
MNVATGYALCLKAKAAYRGGVLINIASLNPLRKWKEHIA